jgi:hypothetical protein
METNLTPFERLFHLCLRIWRELKKRKPDHTQCDLNDVTLGSPAIFEKQDTLKEGQQGILRPVAFRLPIPGDLVLENMLIFIPTKSRIQIHIACQVFYSF